ncbi:MAG: hypothetical protein ACFFG0_33230 [Candidatus Thorarchaeota archaeon]
MSKKRFDNSIVKKEEEKILIGVNKIVCFACGEQIEDDTEICPYCKIPIE